MTIALVIVLALVLALSWIAILFTINRGVDEHLIGNRSSGTAWFLIALAGPAPVIMLCAWLLDRLLWGGGA